MHIATINHHKIAFFWSPKTGHSTMFKILKDNFSSNSKSGWETHSQNIPSNIRDFTFILLYRNPLEISLFFFYAPGTPKYLFQRFCIKLYNIS